eukprot:contig_25527_g6297
MLDQMVAGGMCASLDRLPSVSGVCRRSRVVLTPPALCSPSTPNTHNLSSLLSPSSPFPHPLPLPHFQAPLTLLTSLTLPRLTPLPLLKMKTFMSLLLLAALAVVAATPSTVAAAPMQDTATAAADSAAMGLSAEDVASTIKEWSVRDMDSDSDDDDDDRKPRPSPSY